MGSVLGNLLVFFGIGFLSLRLFCSNHKGEVLVWMTLEVQFWFLYMGWDTPEVSPLILFIHC